MEMWKILQMREEGYDECWDDPKNMSTKTAWKIALAEYLLYQRMIPNNED